MNCALMLIIMEENVIVTYYSQKPCLSYLLQLESCTDIFICLNTFLI